MTTTYGIDPATVPGVQAAAAEATQAVRDAVDAARHPGQIVATFVRGGGGDGPADIARKIRNVALFAGTDDMLPVLEAVRISADGDKLTMEATDRFGLGEETVTLPEPVVVPFAIMVDARALVAAVKGPGRGTFLTLRREVDALTIDDGEGGTVRLPAVEGSFPRTASLWPATVDGDGLAGIGLSTTQLARLGKVDSGERKGRNAAPVVARFTFATATKPCIVHLGETFRALVMPCRLDG